MITESKVIELFCMADDFCKFFDAMMSKYTLRPVIKRSYHRDSNVSNTEITLIMMILFHNSGCRCLKYFYSMRKRSAEICAISFRRLFPYNRFIEPGKGGSQPAGSVHQECDYG